MTSISDPTKEDIEKFIVNNEDLNLIESHINRFNPIRVMKMERMEIRHSTIFAWLLNPRENHGLGDDFLRSFLAEALKGNIRDISALDVDSTSLGDANVFIEWNHIDIFIECPIEKWAFIIENKVYSSQHSGQLEIYKKYVEKRYKDYKVISIFLTLFDEEPEDNAYISIKYSEVLPLLENVLQYHKDTLSNSVYNFIKYYEDIIGELCDMNDDDKRIQSLAKKVYQQNKKVLDYIYEYGLSTEFQYAVTQLLESEEGPNGEFKSNDTEYRYFSQSKSIFSFLPEAWVQTLGELNRNDKGNQAKEEDYRWDGCQNWWAQYPLICWFQIEKTDDGKGKLRLIAEVGPLQEYEKRKNIIDCIAAKFKDTKVVSFQNGSNEEGKKYSKFLPHQQFGKAISDIQDAEAIKDAMDSILDKFAKNVVNQVNDALLEVKSNNCSAAS